jgi:hypothetical protein
MAVAAIPYLAQAAAVVLRTNCCAKKNGNPAIVFARFPFSTCFLQLKTITVAKTSCAISRTGSIDLKFFVVEIAIPAAYDNDAAFYCFLPLPVNGTCIELLYYLFHTLAAFYRKSNKPLFTKTYGYKVYPSTVCQRAIITEAGNAKPETGRRRQVRKRDDILFLLFTGLTFSFQLNE